MQEQDTVVAQRILTQQDRVLWSLVAQLTPDELEEATQLLRDLLADRGRPTLAVQAVPATPDRPVVAD